MNFEPARLMADALLYEGYVLYPYRASAVKNQQRFNFGVLGPRGGDEPSVMRTQCLVEGTRPRVGVMVRFLQLRSREIQPAGATGRSIWQEAVARSVSIDALAVASLCREAWDQGFTFAGDCPQHVQRTETGDPVATIRERQQPLHGVVRVRADAVDTDLTRLTIEIENCSALPLFPLERGVPTRDEWLLSSLVSTHTLVGVDDGQFVSLLDPGDRQAAAAECVNVGTYPVLVGEPGSRDLLLSSPIILYDFPQIAPESHGDFFDGLEIDEMLVLRILTLTDQEKDEMRAGDPRTRELLERAEALAERKTLLGVMRDRMG